MIRRMLTVPEFTSLIVALLMAACCCGIAVADELLPSAAPAATPGATPAATGAPTAAPAAKIAELDDALARLRLGDLEGSLALLKTAAKAHPELPGAHLILARWLANANEPVRARAMLQRAVVEEPEVAAPYLALGQMALAGQSFAEAGLLLEKALALSAAEKDPARQKDIARQSRLGLATLFEARKQWPAAQKHLEAVLADDAAHAAALQALGRALFHQKKHDEALAKFRQAAQADKNLVRAEAVIAGLHQEAGDAEAANRWMLEAIKLDPMDAKTRLAAATWSLNRGKLDQAAEQADAALTLVPDSIPARMIRGTAALFKKDYAAAEKQFQEVHLRAPANMTAMRHLALALCAQKDAAKKALGMEYAQMQAQLQPREPEAQAALGWAYHQLGRSDEAEQALHKAAALGNLSADAAYFYVRVLVDRGHKDEAKKLIKTLESALKAGAVFAQRPEADALVKELGG